MINRLPPAPYAPCRLLNRTATGGRGYEIGAGVEGAVWIEAVTVCIIKLNRMDEAGIYMSQQWLTSANWR